MPAQKSTSADEVNSAPNATIAAQLAHRSIRAYTAEPVDESTMQTLLDVASQAATSSFYQQRTIIRVKDPEVRQRIFESSGQPYVGGDRGELLVFVVDLYRNAQIRERQGRSLDPLETTALFLQGVEDILIAAQNVVVAAESLGLGTVYLGSIGGDPRKVIDALQLPTRTFPLVGLLIGHPDQEPQLKPRLPKEITVGVDAYPDLTDHDDALAAYDEIVQAYYDLRDTSRRIDSFSHQIATKPGSGAAEKAPLLEVLHEQRLALR